MPFSNLRRLLKIGGILVSFVLIIIGIGYVFQVFAWSSAIHPVLGYVVASLFAIVFVALITAPWILLFRLPQAIRLPETEAELPAYQDQLRKRLAKNPYLLEEGIDSDELASEEGLHRAVGLLDAKAKEILERTARHTFLVTAISQNGKLDGLAVLFTQVKMIWQISKVYNQRPVISEVVALYGNIAATTLLAVEVDDLDVTEQVEPLVNSLLKTSATRSIPWAGGAAQLILDSLLEGAINAFFTLRVGVLTMRYSAVQKPMVRKDIRFSSYMEASSLLGTVVVKTSSKVVSSVLRSFQQAGRDTIRSSGEAVGKTVSRFSAKVNAWAGRFSSNREKIGETLLEKDEEETSMKYGDQD
ncbi:MAG TPA: hypothetical protein DCE41_07910 [Cytophagales bacterium]|nr:hypothetical protein [Cytophagales bacterium]HAA19792.1 hypothetical protein [Cytophagales bacterium]HAP64219.1 hypothetical protein [Cytophagales bacterium]